MGRRLGKPLAHEEIVFCDDRLVGLAKAKHGKGSLGDDMIYINTLLKLIFLTLGL